MHKDQENCEELFAFELGLEGEEKYARHEIREEFLGTQKTSGRVIS